mgnify:CR=1 FL=1
MGRSSDKDVQAALIDNFRKYVSADQLPAFYKTIEEKFGGDSRKYVDWLYQTSVVMKSGKKINSTRRLSPKTPAISMASRLTR